MFHNDPEGDLTLLDNGLPMQEPTSIVMQKRCITRFQKVLFLSSQFPQRDRKYTRRTFCHRQDYAHAFQTQTMLRKHCFHFNPNKFHHKNKQTIFLFEKPRKVLSDRKCYACTACTAPTFFISLYIITQSPKQQLCSSLTKIMQLCFAFHIQKYDFFILKQQSQAIKVPVSCF